MWLVSEGDSRLQQNLNQKIIVPAAGTQGVVVAVLLWVTAVPS